MRALFLIFLFISLFITGFSQSKNCFTIENVLVKNDSDNLYLEYRITNTSKSKINLIEADKFSYLKFFSWELEILDAAGNRYESSLMIKRKPASEKDFIQLKPNGTFVIKYELMKYDFMIYEAGKLEVKTPYRSETQINYPLTIKLKYNWDGTYIHSKNGKTKKLKNATFNCESKELNLNK